MRRAPRDVGNPIAGAEADGRQRPPMAQYAIVVGIDRYPALRDLHGASSDAAAFHEWLIDADGGGVPPAHTRLRLGKDLAVDRRRATPKKSDIDDDLDDLVELVRAGPKLPARLWLYFAGHGIGRRPRSSSVSTSGLGNRRCTNRRRGKPSHEVHLRRRRQLPAGAQRVTWTEIEW